MITVLLVGGAATCGTIVGWWPVTLATRRVSSAPALQGRRAQVALSVATPLVLLAVVWGIGIDPVLPAVVVFAGAGVVLAAVDIVEHRLPNVIVLPSLAVTAALLTCAAVIEGDVARLIWSLAGLAAMFGLYLAVALVSPAAMGMGDVKLAGFIGLVLGWFGWHVWVTGLLAGFMIGGLWAAIALVSGRSGLHGSVPFGPSMLAGAVLALVLA